jgi:hypothetical protein
MLNKILYLREKQSNPYWIFISGLMLVGVIGYIDLKTGFELGISVFYILLREVVDIALESRLTSVFCIHSKTPDSCCASFSTRRKLRGSEPGQQIFLVFPEICFANYPGSLSKCSLTSSLGVQYSTEGSEGVPTAHAFGGYWTFIILPEAPDDLKSHICILQSLIAV